MLHKKVLTDKWRIFKYLESLWIPVDRITDVNRILTAFVHKSFAADYREDFAHNERLEFLWDWILWAIINKILFINFPDFTEAQLTLFKIALVREETLAEAAKDIKLWEQVFISRWEEKMNWREKASILSDTFEALIGAIYLDLWVEITENFIEEFLYSKLEKIKEQTVKSHKTLLQELSQKKYKEIPEYRDTEHEVTKNWNVTIYKSEIYIQWKKQSEWLGTSKKKAQEEAAKNFMLSNTG